MTSYLDTINSVGSELRLNNASNNAVVIGYGLTSQAQQNTFGASTIGAITGSSATFSSTVTTTGLLTAGAGGFTSTAGTTSLGSTTINSATVTTTLGVSGLLTAGNGLTSTAGTTTLGASTIGAITGSSASFTTVSTSQLLTANNGLTVATGATSLQGTTVNTTLNVTGTSTLGTTNITGLVTFSGGITTSGNNSMSFSDLSVTTLSSSGVITSTLAQGTAPFSITSNTVVPNLNASLLNGKTFADPGIIGNTTASSATFTTITANTTVNAVAITMTGNISMGNNKITGLGTPTDNTDAVTKVYVDNLIQGLDIKQSVHAATTAPLVLATDVEDRDFIDSHRVFTGDRVLVKNQTNAIENGIYTVNASGPPTRTSDFSNGISVGGTFVFVENGTVNGGTGWVCTNSSATFTISDISLGTTTPTITTSTDNNLIVGQSIAITGNTSSPSSLDGVYTISSITSSTQFVITTTSITTLNTAGTIVIDIVGTNRLSFSQFSGAGSIDVGTGLVKTGNTISVNSSQSLSNLTLTGATNGSVGISAQSTGTTYTIQLPNTTPANRNSLVSNGSGVLAWETLSTINSVTLEVPSFLSVSGSPLTTTGTITIGLSGSALQVANGGTGVTSFTQYGVLLGNGSSSITNDTDFYYQTDILYTPSISITNTGSNSLVIAGGTVINLATDATSEVAGGTITTAGGFAAAKSAFIGTNLTVGTATAATGIMSSKIVQLRGSTSGAVSIKPQPVTGTYDFNLPTSLGASGQMLVSGGVGNPMSWATPSISSAPQSYSTSGVNNQVSPTNVSGLIYSNSDTTLFQITMKVDIVATSNISQIFTLTGVYQNGSWVLSSTAEVGGTSNVVFTITAGGQIQYTSSNYTGFVSLTFTWSRYSTTQGVTYLALTGASGGIVTIVPQTTNFTNYNYNLPGNAGTSGQVLVSGGGGVNPMTWTSSPSFVSVSITNNTASTSTTTGALTVAGGVGIGGALNVGNSINISASSIDIVQTLHVPNLTTSERVSLSIGKSLNTDDSVILYFQNDPTFTNKTFGIYFFGRVARFTINQAGNGYIRGGLYLDGINAPANVLDVNGTGRFSGLISANAGLAVANGQTLNVGTTGSTSPLNVWGLITGSNGLTITGANTSVTTLSASGITSITNNTASSSTTTGALTVAGGVGTGGALYVGGNLNVNGSAPVINVTAGDAGDFMSIRYADSDRYGFGQYSNGRVRAIISNTYGPASFGVSKTTNDVRTGSAGLTDIFTISSAGNVSIPGSLTVSGNSGITSTVTASDTANFNLTLTSDGSIRGKIAFADENHSIMGRVGRDGTVDTMNFYEYGQIRFYTGGVITSQSLRMTIGSGGTVTIPGEFLRQNDVNGVPPSIVSRNINAGSGAYSSILIRNDTANSFAMFMNSSTRTSDGGVNTTTLRNDAGQLRLQNAGGTSTILLNGDTTTISASTTSTSTTTGALVVTGGVGIGGALYVGGTTTLRAQGSQALTFTGSNLRPAFIGCEYNGVDFGTYLSFGVNLNGSTGGNVYNSVQQGGRFGVSTHNSLYSWTGKPGGSNTESTIMTLSNNGNLNITGATTLGGNSGIKVFVMTGTHGGLDVGTIQGFPSNCLTTNIISISGVTFASNGDSIPFDFPNWNVACYAFVNNNLYTQPTASAPTNKAWRVVIITY